MNVKKIKLPHTLALIFIIMIFVALMTWIIPGGEYKRIENDDGKQVVVGNSFEFVANNPQGIFDVLKAPVKGITETAHITGFILLIGGVFAVIQKTGAISALIGKTADILKGKESIVIPVGMTIFSLFGAVFGMSEEVIPFVLIFIPMALTLGYDSIVGVSIPFLGAGIGFAGAIFNPFTVGVAQGIAEIPLFSGVVYRLIVWTIVTFCGIILVMRYANKVKKNPASSPVYDIDQKREKLNDVDSENAHSFTLQRKVIIALFVVVVLAMIFGVMKYNWFIAEIASIFLGLGILSGLIGRLHINTIAESFVDGAKDLVGAALVVGFARAILVLVSDGQIIDTIMYALSNLISNLHPVFAAQFMFILQCFINFFVPSGSGQAALTMPILAPLADLIGVTRQTAVLAFQMGDGFTNMIIPTSGVTMGVLGMAKIPWQKWATWLLPMQVFFFLLALLLLIPPVIMSWQ